MIRTLANWLKSNGHLKYSWQVEGILKRAQWKDGVPSFEWLNNGILAKLKAKAPEAFDEFIELNSDLFAIWSPIKYLGSGLVGDAWLLDDDRVLKIFDEGAQVFNMTDAEKYEDIMKAQYGGTADPNVPMIYEVGSLESPGGFYSVKSPSQKNLYRYYSPGYVIMERLDTPESKAREYLDYNPHLLEPGFIYDEEADEWTEREYSDGEIPQISIDEVPYSLLSDYEEAIHNDQYDDFIPKFVENMFNYIIMDMIGVIERAEDEHDNPEYYDEDDYGEEGAKEDLPFEDSVNKELIIDEMTELNFAEYYDDESIGALERILNLPDGWEEQLATSILNNYFRGRKDLHSGNFGFRNNKIVFFDA